MRWHYLSGRHFVFDGNALEVAPRFSKQGACEKENAEEQGSNAFYNSNPAAIIATHSLFPSHLAAHIVPNIRSRCG
jgi:hypothetical protein